MDPHIFKMRDRLRNKFTIKTIRNKLKEFKENPEEINTAEHSKTIAKIVNTYLKKVNETYKNTTPEHEAYNLLNNGNNKKFMLNKFKKSLKNNMINEGKYTNEEIEQIAKTDKMRKMIKIQNLNC